jgi:hypothetical protein
MLHRGVAEDAEFECQLLCGLKPIAGRAKTSLYQISALSAPPRFKTDC